MMAPVSESFDETTFRNEIDRELVPGFCDRIQKPAGLRFGSCVAYKLFGGEEAEPKRMPTQADAEDFYNDLVSVAQGLDWDTKLTGKLPDAGVRYLVRLANLPGSSIFVRWAAPWWYLDTDDIRPSADWKIEWAAGIDASSRAYFRLFDFTHPQVQGVFSFFYDLEDVFYQAGEAVDEFLSFQERLLEAKVRIDNREDSRLMVKIIQWDNDYRERQYLMRR